MCYFAKACAAFTTRETEDQNKIVHKMTAILNMNSIIKKTFFGYIALSFVETQRQLLPEDNIPTFIAGDIYNLDELCEKYDIEFYKNFSREQIVKELIEDIGIKVTNEFNGQYALFHYDEQKKTLFISVDKYGFFPIYYYYNNTDLIIASEMKCITSYISPVSLDPGAVGDFFFVGNMLGNKTLFSGIRILNPGEQIIIGNKGIEITKIPGITDPITKINYDTRDIYDSLDKAILRRIKKNVHNTILLSAGFDSRIILGFLKKHGIETTALTLSNETYSKGLEGKLGMDTAEVMGIPCDLRKTKQRFYESSDTLDVFYKLDGMVPTFEFFISQIYPELSPELGYVWEGLGLDIALGGHLQFGDLEKNKNKFLAPMRINKRLLKQILDNNFFYEVEKEFQKGFDSEMTGIDGKNWSHFLIKNRTRRRVAVNPLKLYSRKIVPVTPGIDTEFLDFILSIPERKKEQRKLYIKLFEYGFPELTKVPVLSGGNYFEFSNPPSSANKGLKESKGLIRQLVKEWGLGYYGKLIYGKFKGLNKNMMNILPAGLILDIVSLKSVERSIYNKSFLIKTINKVKAGSMLSLPFLMVVFYIELWHLLFIENEYTFLRDEFFFNSEIERKLLYITEH